MTWRDRYVEVLNSPRWRTLRCRKYLANGRRCEHCRIRYEFRELEQHHLHYNNLGEEQAEDVELLCADCHEAADEKREEETDARVWRARLDGWATKVYGEDWEEVYEEESVEECFEEWLESKGLE